jgi:hypothetical protein
VSEKSLEEKFLDAFKLQYNHDFDYDEFPNEFLRMWFMQGYELAKKELEEAREVIEFYAKKEVWGVDTPHMMTSIDPCDQEQLDAWGTRGGKRARAYLEKWNELKILVK